MNRRSVTSNSRGQSRSLWWLVLFLQGKEAATLTGGLRETSILMNRSALWLSVRKSLFSNLTMLDSWRLWTLAGSSSSSLSDMNTSMSKSSDLTEGGGGRTESMTGWLGLSLVNGSLETARPDSGGDSGGDFKGESGGDWERVGWDLDGKNMIKDDSWQALDELKHRGNRHENDFDFVSRLDKDNMSEAALEQSFGDKSFGDMATQTKIWRRRMLELAIRYSHQLLLVGVYECMLFGINMKSCSSIG